MSNQISNCVSCGIDYDKSKRAGKPGRSIVCDECGEEEEDSIRYTGNMVYSCKTNCSIQINTDANLTKYINDTTKLKNKGSNLGNNVNQVSKHNKLLKSEGSCLYTADATDYKNKNNG